jgi:hypothetical protein
VSVLHLSSSLRDLEPSVSRRASLDLQPFRESPGLARNWLETLCTEWQVEELFADLAVAVSELVTNAVLHARTPLTVDVCLGEGVLDVQVLDLSPHLLKVLPLREDLDADIESLLATYVGPEDDDLRHISWVMGSSGSIAAGRGLHLLDALTDCWGVSVLPDRPGKAVWFSMSVPVVPDPELQQPKAQLRR